MWGALASFAGPLLASRASAQFGTRQSRKQMQFQERLSGSAHQREVLDLRAAGLNPILSGTGGQGASAPAGAMTGVDPVSSALSAKRLTQELKNLAATEEKTREETRLIQLGLPAKVGGTDIIGQVRDEIGTAKAKYKQLKEKHEGSTDLGKGRRSYKKGFSKTYK